MAVTEHRLEVDRAQSRDGRAQLRPSRGLILAIALGAFVGMMDATVVAVALDPLSRHFSLPLSAGQSVLSLYLVMVVATLPTLGRLGDRLGRRRSYLAGFAIFAVGSATSALAPSFVILLLGRAIQAVGGGSLTALSLALIAEHAPRRRTGRTVALMVVTQAVAGLVGPPLGGLLVAVWGWQAVFWAGLPLALAGVVLTLRYLPAEQRRAAPGIDVAGAVLLAVLLFGVAAGIADLAGPSLLGLGAPAWFSIAWIALLLLVPAETMARRPLLDPRLFRNRLFGAAALGSLLSTGTLMSCFAFLPFWLEQAHDSGPLLAGLAFLPIALGIGATSRIGGGMADHGRSLTATTTGMSIAALGLGAAAVAARAELWPLLIAGLLLLGIGNGLFSSPNTTAAMGLAPRDLLGAAAGLLSTARNAGVVLGLGLSGAVYTGLSHGGRASADSAATTIFAAAAVICLVVASISVVVHSTDNSRRQFREQRSAGDSAVA